MPTTRATTAQMAANPEAYDPMDLVKALFPHRVREVEEGIKETRDLWENEGVNCHGPGSFDEDFTIPGTNKTHAFKFHVSKGVLIFKKRFSAEETTKRNAEAVAFMAKFKADHPELYKPRRCFQCGKMKLHHKASGGCMECPIPEPRAWYVVPMP